MSQYKKDARGNLVPIANIRPIDLLRDELVQKIIARARAVQKELQEYRRWAMDEIAAFAELSANQYGTSLGGKKGNIRLHSFDGQYRVQLAMQDALVFDEGLAAAKVLIDECIREYSEGSAQSCWPLSTPPSPPTATAISAPPVCWGCAV